MKMCKDVARNVVSHNAMNVLNLFLFYLLFAISQVNQKKYQPWFLTFFVTQNI